MKLWTWQTEDFDLTCGKVIHGASEVEAGAPGLRQAQAELFRLLGEDQIIWCFVRKVDSQWLSSPTVPRRLEWELNVPIHEVIEIINESVWREIFDRHTGASSGDRWSELFLKARFTGLDEAAISGHPDARNATALVRHPVPRRYVAVRPA
jgi:hypothetical protein